MTIGSEILASNYVAIQDKAQSILGSGIGSRGYGQTVSSSDVFTGNIITKEQWDLLRYDIVNIRVHQDGLPPSIITINVGDPIGYGAASPNTNYDALLDTAIANRFNVASNQSIVSAGPTRSYSSAWGTSAQSTLTATFSTADEARYFFNSGGKIRITSVLAGSSNTSQNNAWFDFLNSAGTQSFGAATNEFVNFYTLTNSYQIYYQGSLTTPYSANNYKLEASCNVPDNSAGTATEVYLRVTLSDTYVDPDTLSFANNQPPGDSVDGTLTISVEELKASGNLVPSGTFTITSPTYSLSAISAS
jgi:hypothetical protein